VRTAVLVAALAAAACGDSAVDPLALPVDQRGPYNVGFDSWEVTYTPPGGAGERTILVHMWYPTEDDDGNNPAYENLFRDDDVFEFATPAPPIHDGGYPLLVHSHGHRGFGGNSSDLMAYFASHGWVAVAPNHTGNTLFEGDERPTWLYYTRSFDISRAIDEMATVDLPGPVVTDRVVMSGHSFGTFTTWATAGASFDSAVMSDLCGSETLPDCTAGDLEIFAGGLRDDRVIAAIPMAGGDRGWFGDTGYDGIDLPVLLMTGSDDDVGAAAMFDGIGPIDLTWIDVEGGCHQLFGLGGCDEIGDDEGYAIVNTYALALARTALLGDDDPAVTGIVDGSVTVSERVILQRK
jgi:predicted dienelactone hydrolase